MHSDLCIQGMFFAADNGIDLLSYHKRIYEIVLKHRVDVENIDILAASLSDLLDADAFRIALSSGKYRQIQQEANDSAFKQSGIWVVPAYRMGNRRLDSIEDVYITKQQLRVFLDE
jgi:predicted DsbA family dithiol-disulfide isomerase